MADKSVSNWRELSRERVFDNYRRIDRVLYEQPDGINREYYIDTGYMAVCILAVTPGQEVILCEQYRPGPKRVLLELPGGLVDIGEPPETAAARELLEETGYQGELEWVAKTYSYAYSETTYHAFVARDCRQIKAPDMDTGEFGRTRLMGLDRFREHLRSGQLTDVEIGYLGLDHLGLL